MSQELSRAILQALTNLLYLGSNIHSCISKIPKSEPPIYMNIYLFIGLGGVE